MKVLSKLRESTSANMKLKVDNELLIIMMCHCRFILSKKKKKNSTGIKYTKFRQSEAKYFLEDEGFL